jgi:WD40-like Beta Propeller Repeat
MEVRRAAIALSAITLAGCAGSPTPEKPKPLPGERAGVVPKGGAVLYTIGTSTDAYGADHPNGFGVASGLVGRKLEQVEVRSREYGWFSGAEWLDRGRILVHRKAPPLRRPAMFRFLPGRLERSGLAPFVSGTGYHWSPDRRLLALEPPGPCRPRQRSLFTCYRGGGRIFLVRGDGSHRRLVARGVAPAWTPDGRLVFYRTRRDWARGRAVVRDLASGSETSRDRYWVEETPLASADRRYLADRRGAKERTLILVRRADGRLVARLSTPYVVSMLAWSPRGDRLAYTTSGFPDPHELFLVDVSAGTRRRIFVTGAQHFDWIAWSPDGRWLLLDGDKAGGWRVFSAATGKQVRLLPRLGGRPLWCCPVNKADLNGQRLD